MCRPTAPLRADGPLFLLTIDQAAQTPFPPGCPVVYHFRPSSSASAATDFRSGTVSAVSLNPIRKSFVFRVARRRSSSAAASQLSDWGEDEVDEDELAFASGCPVHYWTAAGADDRTQVAGEIVFAAKHVKDGKASGMRYIVKYAIEENLWRVEEGVMAERLTFDAKGTNDEHSASNANKQAEMSANNTDAPSPPVVVRVSLSSGTSTDGGDSQLESALQVDRGLSPAMDHDERRKASTRLPLKPPPSHALPQEKALSKDRTSFQLKPKLLPQSGVDVRPSTADKNLPQSTCDGVTSPLTCEFSEDVERPAQRAVIRPRPSPKRGAAAADCRTDVAEGAEGPPRKQQKHGNGSGVTRGERLWAEEGEVGERGKGEGDLTYQLTVPLWVLDVPRKTDLFGYLIGANGSKTKNIARESGCVIHISRFKREARQPMRITVTPRGSWADVEKAISMLEKDLQDHIEEAGATGRLRYELRASSSFFSRAASGALRMGGDRWIQLLELPCIDGRQLARAPGKRTCLDPALQRWIWDRTRCAAELFVAGPGTPLARCRPYVLVQGRNLRQVERAAAMVTNARHDPS